MLLPNIQSDAEGLKYVPFAKNKLRILEAQRAAAGLPFIHRRVLAEAGVTVDVTASPVSPQIRISAGGLEAVAQYRGTGVDGLIYDTIAGFSSSGALLWRHDLPGTSLERTWLLGAADDGSRVAYLYVGDDAIEFRTLVGGVLQPSVGSFSAPYVSHTTNFTRFKLSRNAKRAVVTWSRTVGLGQTQTTVFCGADLSPAYTELDTITSAGNFGGQYPFGGDEKLDVVYTGAGLFGYLLPGANLTVKKAVVEGDSAPFSVVKSDRTIELYDSSFSFFEYGGLTVSPTGELAVGYGRLGPFVSGSTFNCAAVLFVEGRPTRVTPSARSDDLSGIGTVLAAVSLPLSVSRNSSSVLFLEITTQPGVFDKSRRYFKDDVAFASNYIAGSMSIDGSVVGATDSNTNGAVVFRDGAAYSGVYAAPYVGRYPFGPSVLRSESLLGAYPLGVGVDKIALRRYPAIFSAEAVFEGYAPETVAPPLLPTRLTRSLTPPLTSVSQTIMFSLAPPDFLSTRRVV